MVRLDARTRFWDTRHVVQFQGDSPPLPCSNTEGWMELYRDKSVLEIGPGEGRQFKTLSSLAQSYSIADISQTVLDRREYVSVAKRFLIRSWVDVSNSVRKGEFDVISFWYVLHHVLKSEAADFFAFLRHATAADGFVHFNCPVDGQGGLASVEDGDGTTTTPWLLDEVLVHLNGTGFTVQDVARDANRAITILAKG